MASEQVAYDLRWTLEFFIGHRFVTDLHQMGDSALSLKVSQGITPVELANRIRLSISSEG